MNIRARLNHLLREVSDSHAAGYSFMELHITNRWLNLYGNPIDTVLVMGVLEDLPFDRICEIYANIREDYPDNSYVQSRYTTEYVKQYYLEICYSVLHTIHFIEYTDSPLGRADSRNADWLYEYFQTKIEEVTGERWINEWKLKVTT